MGVLVPVGRLKDVVQILKEPENTDSHSDLSISHIEMNASQGLNVRVVCIYFI